MTGNVVYHSKIWVRGVPEALCFVDVRGGVIGAAYVLGWSSVFSSGSYAAAHVLSF